MTNRQLQVFSKYLFLRGIQLPVITSAATTKRPFHIKGMGKSKSCRTQSKSSCIGNIGIDTNTETGLYTRNQQYLVDVALL